MTSADTAEARVEPEVVARAAPTLPPAAPVEPAAEQPDPPAQWSPQTRTRLTNAAIVLVIVAAIVAILYAWQLPPFGGRYEQTDNAYVKGQTTIISPQVSGYVSDVPVQDFQLVKAGDVLVRIEDRIYGAKVAQARANVLTQSTNLDNSIQAQKSKEAGELSQDAAIANAQAQLVKVQADMHRTDALMAHGWVTTRDRDTQLAALRAAEAQLRQARANREIGREDVRTVVVGRSGLSANVDAAQAQARLAEIDLDHTVIRAPLAGQLSEIGVRRGQYVTAGTQLMFLVPRTLWVTANFKEAQTRKMHVGQPASFTVDALDGTRLRGHVENMAPAAGSEFAVLKPDNATGNFVKVAQRIAVRIRIDPGQKLADRLRPGMSVVARVDTRD
jgi:multidrug resistance efflux pump